MNGHADSYIRTVKCIAGKSCV